MAHKLFYIYILYALPTTSTAESVDSQFPGSCVETVTPKKWNIIIKNKFNNEKNIPFIISHTDLQNLCTQLRSQICFLNFW